MLDMFMVDMSDKGPSRSSAMASLPLSPDMSHCCMLHSHKATSPTVAAPSPLLHFLNTFGERFLSEFEDVVAL